MTIRQPSDSFVLSAGNGTQTAFSFPFAADRFEDDDVFVYVWNGSSEQWDKKTVSTHYALGTNTVTFTSGNVPTSPPTGISANVLILRKTDIDEDFPRVDFQPGSSIRAQDLDANQLQALRGLKELRDQKLSSSASIAEDGTPSNPKMFANLDMNGFKVVGQPTGYVTSTDILDGTIVNADISGSAAIEGTKINPNFGSQDLTTTGDLTVNDIAVSGNVDGRDVATDGAKLDGIEAGATGDQTNAEIRAAVEAATDSNVFTDADHAKLNAIEAGATADQTATEIKSLYESNADTNVFDDGEKAKLAAIETQATRDQTGTEIKALYEGNADTNAFTDADHTKLDGIASGAEVNVQADWTEADSNSDAFIRNAPDIVTSSGHAAHTPSDTKFLSSSASDARYFRQDSSETIASGNTWSSGDGHVATTAAIDARIIDLIDDVGGFTPIANETSFPSTNPQGNTGTTQLVSIKALSATLTPSSGTITIANGAGTGNTVTITGVTQTLPVGFGVIVETTSTLHTYAFHRLQPKATEVTTVATNITNVVAAGQNSASINNFADRYRVSAADPTARADGSSLQEGDLYYNTAQDVMKAFNGSSYDKITPDSSQLNDIAVVANDISTFTDLGSIADALIAGGSGGAVEVVSDTLEGAEAKTVTVAGGVFVVDGVSNPVLSLRKGWTYTFDQSDASNSNHPFAFKSGSSSYTTGVTVTGTAGSTGAKVVFKVPDSATNLRYYCTVHGNGMGNTITVIEDPITANQDNEANINAVAGNATNINAVQSNESNINTVAGISANVTTVAGISSNVTTVAGNTSNINSVQSNASNINTVAGSISDVNRYANEYQIASNAPSNPSAGDLWFDTANLTLKNYNGTAWLGITSNSGIQNVLDDNSPELAAALDCNNNDLTEVGTVSGNNLQIDFGTL